MTKHRWVIRDQDYTWGVSPLVMGILNITPDSFSDGGTWLDVDAAVARAGEMVKQGAAIIDVGGESTRPGAPAVNSEEEIARVLPVITRIIRDLDCIVSVDTTKSVVADAAMSAGAHIINDVSAMTADHAMIDVAVSTGAGVVLMHRKGSPETMQRNPEYKDVVSEVRRYLQERLAVIEEAGIDKSRVVLDPGIGFGKTLDHNLELIRGLEGIAELGCPVLMGASRKRFIGAVLDREVDERLAGSLAVAWYSVQAGASILRVHDVKETCDFVRMMDTLDPVRGS